MLFLSFGGIRRNNLHIKVLVLGREPEGSVGTKLVNKAHGDFWGGIYP